MSILTANNTRVEICKPVEEIRVWFEDIIIKRYAYNDNGEDIQGIFGNDKGIMIRETLLDDGRRSKLTGSCMDINSREWLQIDCANISDEKKIESEIFKLIRG